MKKAIYGLIIPLVVASVIAFANRDPKEETGKKPMPQPLSAADKASCMKLWYATSDGINFKRWEESPAGKKVYASEAKIGKYITNYSSMEAVVTSLLLPQGSNVGFGMIVRIDGEDFILSFGVEDSNEFEQLHGLLVGDRLVLKSHNVSHAPKYAYPIITAEYVERYGKMIYKRVLRKGGC